MTNEYKQGFYDGMMKAASLIRQSGWVKFTKGLAQGLEYAATAFQPPHERGREA